MAAQTMFLWLATAILIAFNTAVAFAHNPAFTLLALALTALFASFVLAVGIWNGVKATRKLS